jgi:predicted AAA+ superfamily ATPase
MILLIKMRKYPCNISDNRGEMRRTIEKRLCEWKGSKNRKPLVIRGARQVGKTYTVNRFGREEFADFFVFDFERTRSLHRVFRGDLDPTRILSELEIEAGKPIVPSKTLVFFDEIQACPEAISSLRYFYEELPQLHIIAAGSLLELALGDVSFPVGRVEFEWMRPLSFAEFLEGTGKGLLADKLPRFAEKIEISEAVHAKLIEQLRLYFLVGGMPEAVSRYAETGSFHETADVHRALVLAYLQSFAKYNKRANIAVLENLLEQIPRQVGLQLKYQKLEPGRHTETIKTALRILERSLLVTRVRSSPAQGLPLSAGSRAKVFKAVFVDIGLMQHLSGVDIRDILHEKDILNVYRGALAEQFVGQELLASGSGSENDKLYYWSRAQRGSSAEVDYLLVRQGQIHPIEVKAGQRGTLKSLALFLKEHPASVHGLVLSPNARKSSLRDKIIYLPIYTNLC